MVLYSEVEISKPEHQPGHKTWREIEEQNVLVYFKQKFIFHAGPIELSQFIFSFNLEQNLIWNIKLYQSLSGNNEVRMEYLFWYCSSHY